jgi:hypothetical protein
MTEQGLRFERAPSPGKKTTIGPFKPCIKCKWRPDKGYIRTPCIFGFYTTGFSLKFYTGFLRTGRKEKISGHYDEYSLSKLTLLGYNANNASVVKRFARTLRGSNSGRLIRRIHEFFTTSSINTFPQLKNKVPGSAKQRKTCANCK